MNENIDTPSTQSLPLSKNLIALLVVLFVIVAGASGAVGAYFYTSATHSSSGTVASTPAPVLHNPTPTLPVVHTTAGTVAAIKGNTLTLASANTTVPNSTVLINSSTVIFKLTLKNSKAFQTQLNAFLKAHKAGTKATPPRATFATTTLSTSELSVGQRITVTSQQNIVTLNKFTASKIQVYSKSPINNLK